MNTIQIKAVIAVVLTGLANKYLGKFLPADQIGAVVDAVSVIVIAGATGFFFTRNTVINDASNIAGVHKIETKASIADALPDNNKVVTG